MATRVTTTNALNAEASVTIDLSMADAKLVGEDPERPAGIGLSGAGDVDGDGHDDLLVGAAYNNEGGGRTPVPPTWCWAQSRGPSTCPSPMPSSWAKTVRLRAEASQEPGDVDGDGHDDVLVGAYGNDEGG